MYRLASVRAAVTVLVLVASGAAGAQSVPVAYEDDYVTVSAGIAEAGAKPIHLGDALTLVVDIDFDPRIVQVENLDDEIFQQAFAGSRAIRPYGPVTTSTHGTSRDRAKLKGVWRLQIVDCPEDTPSCPGSRAYELPVMTVAYQLTDRTKGSADSRSARFRPWPGTLDVASAIAVVPEAGVSIDDVLPGGAYPDPEAVAEPARSRSPLLIAGVVLLAGGFLATGRGLHRELPAVRPYDADGRWEQALTQLRDASLDDDAFSDLLRRCLTWYCLDECGQNPYAWLGAAASDAASRESSLAALRELFVDVLHQERIAKDERSEYLARLEELTGAGLPENAT